MTELEFTDSNIFLVLISRTHNQVVFAYLLLQNVNIILIILSFDISNIYYFFTILLKKIDINSSEITLTNDLNN